MSGKNLLVLILIVGLFALVYGISIRLSTEAINIIAGVTCGIAASIPVSLGLLIALMRDRSRPVEYLEDVEPEPERPTYTPPAPPQPYQPIILMAPQPGQMPNPYQLPPGAFTPGYNLNEPPRTRDFKIIGDDEDDID